MLRNIIKMIFLFVVITKFHTTKCLKLVNKTEFFKLESKIIGGYPVKIESFPFAILLFNSNCLCSGVILNSYSILTAAHCFDHNRNVEEMMIEINVRYIHEDSAEIYEVQSFVVHEDYNKMTSFYADIAVVFVKEPIKFGPRKKKALLAYNDDWMKFTNNDIIAVGWGWTEYGGSLSELGLLRTNLRFVGRRKCENLHKLSLTEDMFCLYGDGTRDTCKGDSGGGVVWNGTVIGIVSHGDGCAKKNKPSIYISVNYYRRWIERTVTQFVKNYCNKILFEYI